MTHELLDDLRQIVGIHVKPLRDSLHGIFLLALDSDLDAAFRLHDSLHQMFSTRVKVAACP